MTYLNKKVNFDFGCPIGSVKDQHFCMGKSMANCKIWKVAAGLALICLSSVSSAQVGTLSEGACWYDNKDPLKIASFNDKSVYNGSRAQVEAELEALMGHQKISDMDLYLHCGGYGASLVARVSTDNGQYCLWTRFEKGKLVTRSLGALAEKNAEDKLCDGHKSGELIIGVQSKEFAAELQGAKWSSIIKEVRPVSDRVYQVLLMKDYANREAEIASQLEENFAGKNQIRYIEMNEYHHPVGEYINLK